LIYPQGYNYVFNFCKNNNYIPHGLVSSDRAYGDTRRIKLTCRLMRDTLHPMLKRSFWCIHLQFNQICYYFLGVFGLITRTEALFGGTRCVGDFLKYSRGSVGIRKILNYLCWICIRLNLSNPYARCISRLKKRFEIKKMIFFIIQ
jgi:hypothetical protein